MDARRRTPASTTGSNEHRSTNLQRKQRQQPMRTTTNSKQQQFSSVLLFVSVIVLVNLCPFEQEFDGSFDSPMEGFQLEAPKLVQGDEDLTSMNKINESQQRKYLSNKLEQCLRFAKLVFSNPIKLGKRTMRYTQAEARVLGKMAKVWYIKKKIKKLGKKLKKKTIAVPVFTAIPIYEHSYYPQPHVTHVSHGAMHHHAAASSYSPAVAQLTAVASTPTTTNVAPSQQLATSASNNHQVTTYRMAPSGNMYHHPSHHHHPSASAHQIINAYAPSPPLYVDEAGGLYGHYGNAYGRYDGGYQYW